MVLLVTPPSWRPDLTDPADLAEEVIRLEGYGNVPVRHPRATAGTGLSARQQALRAIARTLGGAGFVEVHSDPFAPADEADNLMLVPEDPRRPAVKVANPLSEDQPQLRTTLLPGLFRTLQRNLGRGFPDTALFETGQVFLPRPGSPGIAPILATDRGPTEAELATLAAALPDQPPRVAGVLAGNRELPGWWGPGRAAVWADAIEAARSVGAVSHLDCAVRATAEAPWHPGRCAALYVRGSSGGEWLAGHAGELHPRVIAAYGLPPRTSAFELDFAVLSAAAAAAEPVRGPALSAYPLATQDVALVVAREVPAAEVAAACGPERANCLRTCGCSTSTPARSWPGTASPSPTRCGCARRTGRSPPPRRPPPATPRSARRPGAPARCSAPSAGLEGKQPWSGPGGPIRSRFGDRPAGPGHRGGRPPGRQRVLHRQARRTRAAA